LKEDVSSENTTELKELLTELGKIEPEPARKTPKVEKSVSKKEIF
jgi:hypothetical protein